MRTVSAVPVPTTQTAVYKSTSELGTSLYTGQPSGSQGCLLQRGSTVSMSESCAMWVHTNTHVFYQSLHTCKQAKTVDSCHQVYTDLEQNHCKQEILTQKFNSPYPEDVCHECPSTWSQLHQLAGLGAISCNPFRHEPHCYQLWQVRMTAEHAQL